MRNQTNALSSFHTTSSSLTVLVATNTGNDRANTMSASGIVICRKFQRGSCTYGARCKFVHGNNDLRPRPTSTTSRSTGKNNSGKGKKKKDETPPLPKTLLLPKTRPHRNATSKPKELATRNWLDIPSDLMMNILQRINATEILLNVQRVCTNWRQICKDPCTWRVIYLDYQSSVKHGLGIWQYYKPFSYGAKYEICKNVVDRSQGQLVDITIIGFSDDKLLQYVADRSSQLRRLEVRSSTYPMFLGHLTKALKKFPLLEELSLEDIEIEEAIRTLGRDCPMLKTLKLSNEFGLKDDALGLAIAENLPGLRYLELSCCNLSDTGVLAILDRCCHLQVLDLRDYPSYLGKIGKRCL
ncbi:RNI-like superfamily protein [Artemisia annua]|uniref:RNI-like superfamily protein n=1 Tax=Artemisia annua TaxID=35608 RepID=A0A2U1Q1K8_ARTAN|nr:RNI-like superfamily protein [Artemisia annua]